MSLYFIMIQERRLGQFWRFRRGYFGTFDRQNKYLLISCIKYFRNANYSITASTIQGLLWVRRWTFSRDRDLIEWFTKWFRYYFCTWGGNNVPILHLNNLQDYLSTRSSWVPLVPWWGIYYPTFAPVALCHWLSLVLIHRSGDWVFFSYLFISLLLEPEAVCIIDKPSELWSRTTSSIYWSVFIFL